MDGMQPLDREAVVAGIERQGPPRVPTHRMDYINRETRRKYGEELARIVRAYPSDVVAYREGEPDWERLGEGKSHAGGIDSRGIVDPSADLDAVAEGIRSLAEAIDFAPAAERRRKHPDRYCLGYTWYCLFERLWMLCGMENVLLGFYERPEALHRLLRAIADYHLRNIRSCGELGYDGIATSDDLGGQTGPLFSREILAEFFLPLYRELFAAAHDYSMHVWFHSCGAIEPIVPDLIDAGIDLLHPIQHSTYPGGVSANDPKRVAAAFADCLTFWAGIDVQYLLPRGTEEEVRAGVREWIDTFDGPGGGMVAAAGNGIMPETPLENIRGFYEETYRYGRARHAGAAAAVS